MTQTPELQTDVFVGHEDARYWIGIVAEVGGRVLMPEEFRASLRLRANSYIDAHGYLPESVRDNDGQETDADDVRAEHLVVLENLGDGLARAVATHRTIDRRTGALPCEDFFPDHFPALPADAPVMERSRVISATAQAAVFFATTRACYFANAARGITHSFGMMEQWLIAYYGKCGFAIDELSPELPIEHYNTPNILVRMDIASTIEQVTAASSHYALAASFRWAAENGSDGLGYAYEDDLLELLK